MGRIGVGVMHNTINSRFGPKPLVHADYAIGLACGADSFGPPYVEVVRGCESCEEVAQCR